MVAIWGANYSVIKAALREIPPIPFNGLRLLIASAMFLLVIAVGRVRGSAAAATAPRRLSWRDWTGIAALGFVGHFVYQLLFISGLNRTSAANTSLEIGATPVFVALMTAAVGHEHISRRRWAGTVLSAFGIYLVVGRGAAVTRASLAGDLTMLGAVLCWSAATVASRPLLARHSPMRVTGFAMSFGAVLYAIATWGELQHLPLSAVSASAWLSLAGSAILALFAAYLIWFTAVQKLGNTRTSVYSNLVPLVGISVAWLWLGEPIGWVKVAGAAAILSGVALARI